jgi:hypothetical protein
LPLGLMYDELEAALRRGLIEIARMNGVSDPSACRRQARGEVTLQIECPPCLRLAFAFEA